MNFQLSSLLQLIVNLECFWVRMVTLVKSVQLEQIQKSPIEENVSIVHLLIILLISQATVKCAQRAHFQTVKGQHVLNAKQTKQYLMMAHVNAVLRAWYLMKFTDFVYPVQKA